MQETTEIGVCSDCIELFAGGGTTPDRMDEDETADYRARIGATFESYGEGAHLAYGGEDLGFSHYQCELCHDGLAGGRTAMTMFWESE